MESSRCPKCGQFKARRVSDLLEEETAKERRGGGDSKVSLGVGVGLAGPTGKCKRKYRLHEAAEAHRSCDA
jgi:hypothetical protein